MLHFIPAWYADDSWSEQEQSWYSRRMHTEFDDTVKHVQLFHRNRIAPFEIMLLSYAPNFRHFLHRQGVYHAPYWSCFDAIQSISRKKAALLSYHNLKWPEGTEFLYTMFAVVAMRNGQKYAQIEFGEDGNLIRIDLYEGGCLRRKNLYDDRGFVSSTIIYQQGMPYYQDYLDEGGNWRIRRFFQDGHVQVNPQFPNFRLERWGCVWELPFRSQRYDSLEQVIAEVVREYIGRGSERDIFCAALHPLHMPLIERVFRNKRLILSVFEGRWDMEDNAFIQALGAARHLICDSQQSLRLLQKHGKEKLPNCTVITPFDSRPDFGKSQQTTSQKILVPVDGLKPEVFKWLAVALGQYLLENPDAQLYLFTREATYGLEQKLLQQVRGFLEEAGLPWLQVPQEKQEQTENAEPVKSLSQRCFAQQCVDELAVSRCLRQQRLIVDFRNVRDVYLRIVAISMGIPQILLYPSEFVVSGKNGIVLTSPRSLFEALRYYLDELANWNRAMVCAYEIGKQFDTKTQVENWKGVLDSFE